jgi:hypothetical protein
MPRSKSIRRYASAPAIPEVHNMPTSSTRNLLPVVLTYLPVPIAGAILSAAWNVGASPQGGAGDMFFAGTALTPPLFLPVILVGASVAARRNGVVGRIGAGLTSLVAVAFLAGSTFNLPNDFAAADAAGTPLALSAGLAVIHIVLSLTLLYNALPTVIGRPAERRAATA